MCHAFVRPPQIYTFVHWLDFLEGDTLKTMLIRSCCFLWIRHREWTSDRKRGRDFRGRVWQQEVSVCLLILHVENNTWCLWSSTMIIVLTAFWVGTVQTGSSGSYLLIETSWMFLCTMKISSSADQWIDIYQSFHEMKSSADICSNCVINVRTSGLCFSHYLMIIGSLLNHVAQSDLWPFAAGLLCYLHFHVWSSAVSSKINIWIISNTSADL